MTSVGGDNAQTPGPAIDARPLLIAAAAVAAYVFFPATVVKTFELPVSCDGMSLSSPGATFTVGGGSGSVGVIAPSDCDWNASSPVPWIVMDTASGTGNGTATFTVQEDRTGAPRNANLTIGTQTFAVTQEISFLDPNLDKAIIRAQHIIEVRIRIDVLRERLAMAPYPWTDPVLVVGTTVIRSPHVGELRGALFETYKVAGYVPLFQAPPAFPGTVIWASQLWEMRDHVEHLEEQLGPVPRPKP